MTDMHIEPKSEQLDAVDLLAGPRTFTVEKVSRGSAEQPVNIHLAGFPRPWRPGVSMRRVLVACWGPDTSAYIGRRVTLYCEPKVMFGTNAVGGTRISHLSHITERKKIPLLVSQGRSGIWTVDPLTDTPRAGAAPEPQTSVEPIVTAGAGGLTAADRIAALRAEWKTADPERRKAIEAEVAALTNADPDADYLAAVAAQDES